MVKNTLQVTVADGKYTVIQDDAGATRALRYGEEWRDCVGDGLILALAQRVDELESEKSKKSQMDILSDLIEEPLKFGCLVEMTMVDNIYNFNLSTGAKSSCILKLEHDKIVAYRRYDRVDVVEDYNSLLWLVHDCAHGRDFFSSDWLAVFEANGIDNPIK